MGYDTDADRYMDAPQVTQLHVEERKANKSHDLVCGCTIGPGDTYFSCFAIVDGKPEHTKLHTRYGGCPVADY